MRFIIVTGMSGAGRTQASHCMEDMGYYCIDNLPPVLIDKFADILKISNDKLVQATINLVLVDETWYYKTEVMTDYDEEYIINLPDSLNLKLNYMLDK